MTDKTLQDRLRDREGDNDDDLIDAAADALDAQAEQLQMALGALADIATSQDMTLETARNKAARIYAEITGGSRPCSWTPPKGGLECV